MRRTLFKSRTNFLWIRTGTMQGLGVGSWPAVSIRTMTDMAQHVPASAETIDEPASAETIDKPQPQKRQKKPIMLFASEVSTIVGSNPYRRTSESFEKVWQRTWPAQYKRAKMQAEKLTSEPVLTKEEEIHIMLKEHNLLHLQEQAVQAAETADSVHALPQVKAVFEEAVQATGAPEQVKAQLRTHIKSTVNTTFGQANEASAISKFEYVARTKVRENNAKFYSMELGDTDPHLTPWALGGRIDGFDQNKLVEVKNRTKSFLEPLPQYDLVQFQCYLHILDLDDGTLVENLKGAGSDEESVKSTYLAKDPQMWQETIFPRLQGFCDFLDQFRQESYLAAQAEYLTLDDDAKHDFLAPINHREQYWESTM